MGNLVWFVSGKDASGCLVEGGEDLGERVVAKEPLCRQEAFPDAPYSWLPLTPQSVSPHGFLFACLFMLLCSQHLE